ncbi:hypothetical protein B7486_78265, partial [cyanobacterium TDX16]
MQGLFHNSSRRTSTGAVPAGDMRPQIATNDLNYPREGTAAAGSPGERRDVDGDTPRYLVLGPVAALDGDAEPIDLGGAQRRAVLAKLVLNAGRVLTVETIADGLWPGEPPPSAKRSIEAVVAKLKKLLPDGDVATHRPGYSLQVPAALTDVGCFEAATAAAGVHVARGE